MTINDTRAITQGQLELSNHCMCIQSSCTQYFNIITLELSTRNDGENHEIGQSDLSSLHRVRGKDVQQRDCVYDICRILVVMSTVTMVTSTLPPPLSMTATNTY